MSVITTYELAAKNIKQRLIENGYVHSDILHDRRGKERHFDNVLDYNLCNPKRAAELKQYYAETGWLKMTANGKWEKQEYTDTELNDLMKYPVYFDQTGDAVMWHRNHGFNDTPSLFITDLYPDEVMSLTSRTEGELNYSIYIKGDKTCTKDGRTINGMLKDINTNQIENVGNNQSKVKFLLDITDKEPAYIYVNNNDVQDTNINFPSDKKNVCIEKLSDSTQVYRQLKDGSQTTETMTFGDMLRMHNTAEEQKLKNRKLPDVSMEETSPEDTYDFE